MHFNGDLRTRLLKLSMDGATVQPDLSAS